jgi:hypothetical protein
MENLNDVIPNSPYVKRSSRTLVRTFRRNSTALLQVQGVT